jgi:hypothetical protein
LAERVFLLCVGADGRLAVGSVLCDLLVDAVGPGVAVAVGVLLASPWGGGRTRGVLLHRVSS